MSEVIQPIHVDGIPQCSEECPQHDGKRCKLLGHQPESVCIPAVRLLSGAPYTPPDTSDLRVVQLVEVAETEGIDLLAVALASLARAQPVDAPVLHIVFGEAGEYSDHEMWPVRAFLIKEEADSYAVQCSTVLDEILVSKDSDDLIKHPLDSHWNDQEVWTLNSGAARYYSEEIPWLVPSPA